MSTTSYGPHDVVLLPIPFPDLTSSKVRPAIVVGRLSPYNDLIVLPVTSRLSLLPTEYRLKNWSDCGLNVPSAIKPQLATVASDRVVRKIGSLSEDDRATVSSLLGNWLGEAMQSGKSSELPIFGSKSPASLDLKNEDLSRLESEEDARRHGLSG